MRPSQTPTRVGHAVLVGFFTCLGSFPQLALCLEAAGHRELEIADAECCRPADAAAAAGVGPVLESAEGWNDHDSSRVRTVFADRVVVDDRRRAGMGLLEGADVYVEALAPLWKLAPDIQVEPRFPLALEHYGMVGAGRIFGTFPEGGPFEGQLVWVFIFAHGRITRLEIFEIEDVDAALARFAELRPETAA